MVLGWDQIHCFLHSYLVGLALTFLPPLHCFQAFINNDWISVGLFTDLFVCPDASIT